MQTPATQTPATHAPPESCGLAVITGHMALGKIKRSGDTIGGSGMATTGLILGYVTTGLTLLWILPAIT